MGVIRVSARVRRAACTALVVLASSTITAGTVRAAEPGDLDATFGRNGRTELQAGSLRLTTTGVDVLRQDDGRLVLLHSSSSLSGPNVIVTRHLRDGRLDRSFGDGGRVVVPTAPYAPIPLAATLQGDKIVIVGALASLSLGFQGRPFVMRLTADGRRDATFGRRGRVTLDLGGPAFNTSVTTAVGGGLVVAGTTATEAYAVRLDAAGRVVTGYADSGIRRIPSGLTTPGQIQPVVSHAGGGQVHLAFGALAGSESITRVVRLDENGAVRSDFGSPTGVDIDATTGDEGARALLRQGSRLLVVSSFLAGAVITALDPSTGAVVTSWGDAGRRAVGLPDPDGSIGDATLDDRGRVVLVGSAPVDESSVWFITRLRPGGSPDTGFGGDGQVSMTMAGQLGVRAVTSAGRGYAVAATVGDHAAVARITLGGSLSSEFGRNGVAVPRVVVAATQPRSVMVESTGRTIVSGYSYRTEERGDAVLWRLDRRGRPDPTFGVGGRVTIAARTRSMVADSVVRLADGRYVVALRMQDDERSWMVVARLLSDGRPDRTFGPRGRRVVGAASIQPENGLIQLRVDASGRYVLGVSGPGTIQFARRQPDGRPDTSFGSNGILTIAPGVTSSASLGSFRVLTDGRLAVVDLAGRRILRRNADGTPALDFGPDGAQPLLVAPAFTQGLADVRPSGAVVLAALDISDGALVVARVGATGLPDETFGTSGVLRRPAVDDRRLQPTALTVRSDGSILLAAVASVGGFNPLTAEGDLVRVTSTGELDTSFGGDGVARVDLGGAQPDILIGVAAKGSRAVVLGGVFGASPTVFVARVVL